MAACPRRADRRKQRAPQTPVPDKPKATLERKVPLSLDGRGDRGEGEKKERSEVHHNRTRRSAFFMDLK
jgi:hypothetical protein